MAKAPISEYAADPEDVSALMAKLKKKGRAEDKTRDTTVKSFSAKDQEVLNSLSKDKRESVIAMEDKEAQAAELARLGEKHQAMLQQSTLLSGLKAAQ